MADVWLVTGASRGLGLEIARAALAAGKTVVATARSKARVTDALGADGDTLLALDLDITDADAAGRAAQHAVDRFGALDVLVNNAGQGQLGWFETISEDHVRRQFETNVFGTMNVARAVAPHMRARRSGMIVTISSVSGLVSNAGGSIYSASKFAIEGWMEGFAEELLPLGIRSLVVEPGMLRTDFLDDTSAAHGDIAIADYAEAVSQFRSFIAGANHNQPGDPQALAGRIVDIASQGEPPSRFVFGDDALGWAAGKADRLKAEIERSRALAQP